MKQVWNDIKLWIEANAPHLLTYLAPAVTIQDIEDAESKLNFKFSESFKEFYMFYHFSRPNNFFPKGDNSAV